MLFFWGGGGGVGGGGAVGVLNLLLGNFALIVHGNLTLATL